MKLKSKIEAGLIITGFIFCVIVCALIAIGIFLVKLFANIFVILAGMLSFVVFLIMTPIEMLFGNKKKEY